MTTVALREASPEDAERLYTLKRACFAEAYLDLSVFRSPESAAYLGALALPALKERHPIVIAGEFEGYIQAVIRGEVIHLNYIGVHPSRAGRGLGRELLNAFHRLGRDAGCRRATLDVFASNAVVLAWYEREGYRESSRSVSALVDLAGVSPQSVGTVYQAREEALAEERAQGFSMIGTESGEVGIIAGDTVRPRLPLAPEALARAMRADFPERTRMILMEDPGDLPTLDSQISLRLERDL